ncbi:MAG: DUF4231 domain-containing protein [Acidobacteriota bacterium]
MTKSAEKQGSTHERTVLEDAWERFATYDLNAVTVQQQFYRLRIWILAVGVAATALAIVYAHVTDSNERPAFGDWRFPLWLAVIVAPILGTVLTAGASKLARGADWIHLRGAAEAAKREIYRYRCRVGDYAPTAAAAADDDALSEDATTDDATADEATAGGDLTRDERLSAVITAITARLMDSEILGASLKPYAGPLPPKYGAGGGDDGFSDLSPATYLEWRLADQQAFFRSKSQALDHRHRRFQWAISALGGLGTLLAAVGREIWVPVSVGLATALGAYLELRNVESTLAGYNRAAMELDNIVTWWSGLSPAQREDPVRFETLIDRTEALLASENATWSQGMQEALAQLDKSSKAEKKGS